MADAISPISTSASSGRQTVDVVRMSVAGEVRSPMSASDKVGEQLNGPVMPESVHSPTCPALRGPGRVFGVGISIVYLLLFNRRTRQSLHDLAVGAYVVSAKIGDSPGGGVRVWPIHFGVVGVILISALFLPHVVKQGASSSPFDELLAVQRALQQNPDVLHSTAAKSVN